MFQKFFCNFNQKKMSDVGKPTLVLSPSYMECISFTHLTCSARLWLSKITSVKY